MFGWPALRGVKGLRPAAPHRGPKLRGFTPENSMSEKSRIAVWRGGIAAGAGSSRQVADLTRLGSPTAMYAPQFKYICSANQKKPPRIPGRSDAVGALDQKKPSLFGL